MPTPGTSQAALRGTQSDENPSAARTLSEGGRWALYARSGGPASAFAEGDTGRIEHSAGILMQLEPLRALVAARGGTVVAEFVDYGKPSGPGRGDLMQGALLGQFEHVAAYDLSRLTRDRGGEAGGLLDGLANVNVGLTLIEGAGVPNRLGGLDLDRAYLTMLAAQLSAFTAYDTATMKARGRRPFGR